MSYMLKICNLFCPPCPSRIIDKLAYYPPDPATYSLHYHEDDDKFCFYMELETDIQFKKHLEKTDFFYTDTCYGTRIACMYIRNNPQRKLTVFYSHGNGSDLGGTFGFLTCLATQLGCNAFSYDYSGYGASTGKPSEKQLYGDIAAAYAAITERYGLCDLDVILYGQSLGTVPTIDLASRMTTGGVIIQSGMSSACRIVFDKPPTCCDSPLKK